MTTTGFFLNHVPEGSMLVYEFHKERPFEDFDYHQIYGYNTEIKSKLLSEKNSEFLEKIRKIRKKHTNEKNRLYVEWDNPLGGELKTPAMFLDFGPWWKTPEADLPTEEVWNQLLLEFAQAAGYDWTLDDIPECPDGGAFKKVCFGFFPARDQTTPWFRVCYAHNKLEEYKKFAESLNFSTKWFDKFDIVKHCETCLISFNVNKHGIYKPAAEMILKPYLHHNVPEEFSQFREIHDAAMEMISANHGPHIEHLHTCHYKVELTEESYAKQEAKMYMFARVKAPILSQIRTDGVTDTPD